MHWTDDQTSEFGELVERHPVQKSSAGKNQKATSIRRQPTPSHQLTTEDLGPQESFLDVGAELEHKRSRKDTLKARSNQHDKSSGAAKQSRRSHGHGPPGLPEQEASQHKKRVGLLTKKASKLFKLDKSKSRNETLRPRTANLETSLGDDRSLSCSPPSTHPSRRDSLTTTCSELSMSSAHEQCDDSATHVSVSSTSRPSSASSNGHLNIFKPKSRRGSSNNHSNKADIPVLVPSPNSQTEYLRDDVGNLQGLAPTSSSNSHAQNSRPLGTDDWEEEDLSSIRTKPNFPQVITTSATPDQVRSRNALESLPSAVEGSNQPSLGGRMSNWFANIIPGNASAGPSQLPHDRSSGGPTRWGNADLPLDGRHSVRTNSSGSNQSNPIVSSASAPARTSIGSTGDSVFNYAASSTASPSRKLTTTSTFLQVARQKAAGVGRWMLDNEAQPDGCQDPIWVLGLQHRSDAPMDERGLELEDTSEEGSWGRYQSGGRLATSPNSARSPSPSSGSYFSSKVGPTPLLPGVSPSRKSLTSVAGDGESSQGSPGRGMRSLLSKNRDKPSNALMATWPDECESPSPC